MKTTNTQKKSSKRTRAAPDHTNQLTEIPAQPVEVLSPRQTLVQTVCSLTGTKEAQAMQIASNHLYDYCLMPDKEVAEFVGHLEAIELLCDCLAFGMLDGTSRSQADQIDWLIRFVKEYKKTKATLVSPTRKKPDQSVWKANTKVMVWQQAALACDIDPNEINIDDIEDYLSPDLHEFRQKLLEYTEAARTYKLEQALFDKLGVNAGGVIIVRL